MKLIDLVTLADEPFLHSSYLYLLDREIDESGKVNYLKKMLHGFSRLDVLKDIYTSSEGKQNRTLSDLQKLPDELFITSAYKKLLKRLPDDEGMSHYLQLIKKGKRRNVVPDLKASEEYILLHKEQIELEKDFLLYLKRNSWKQFFLSLISRKTSPVYTDEYMAWIAKYELFPSQDRNYILHNHLSRTTTPDISIVVSLSGRNTENLENCIQSAKKQSYQNWELVLIADLTTTDAVKTRIKKIAVNESRIKLVTSDSVEEGPHVGLNVGLHHVTGRFVLFLDPEDQLPEMALWQIAEASANAPETQLFYGDEDQLDEAGNRLKPYFKSDYNYFLHLAQNLTGRACVFDTGLLKRIEGFRLLQEDVLFWDASLRAIEQLNEQQITHIPRILYNRRLRSANQVLGATNGAGRRIVAEHLERKKIQAEVLPAPELPRCNRIKFARPESQPLVSIIIPTRDRGDLLQQCVASIREKSSYGNYEILIVDNGSQDPATLALLQQLAEQGLRVERLDIPFNYSILNNLAAEKAQGEYLCFLNNDTEILTPDWLEEMLSFAAQEQVGIVGARLWYPDGRIQHAGVITGRHGNADHIHKGLARDETGYFGRAVLHQSLSAVTGACIVMRRSVFEQVSGFDEAYPVSLGDIDLCLRVQELGYTNVWTPYAELIHHESVSRGLDAAIQHNPRLAMETVIFHNRWGDQIFQDPAYNPNLSLDGPEFYQSIPSHLGRIGQISSATIVLLSKEQFPILKEAQQLAIEALIFENANLRRASAQHERVKTVIERDNEELHQNFLAQQEETKA